MKNILLVVTNAAMYASGRLRTGLWLSELTHIYDSAKKAGWAITIASPRGGHGTMYDFPDDTHLQQLIRQQYESGKMVTAICHRWKSGYRTESFQLP